MCENIRTSGKLVMLKINKLARNEHAHFHPSGVSEPSKEDINYRKAGKGSWIDGDSFLWPIFSFKICDRK